MPPWWITIEKIALEFDGGMSKKYRQCRQVFSCCKWLLSIVNTSHKKFIVRVLFPPIPMAPSITATWSDPIFTIHSFSLKPATKLWLWYTHPLDEIMGTDITIEGVFAPGGLRGSKSEPVHWKGEAGSVQRLGMQSSIVKRPASTSVHSHKEKMNKAGSPHEPGWSANTSSLLLTSFTIENPQVRS